MTNWDRGIGEHYLQRTVYEARELFAEVLKAESPDAEPLRFKVYRGVPRFPLREGLPLALGDVRWSFDDFAPAGAARPDCEVLDVLGLSTLLYYCYGFSRRDKGPGAVWPDHRLVPSARCLFPTELYVWVPAIGELAAGLYHYDNLHHQLALIRPGDLRDELSCVLGSVLDGAHCVLLASSLFWKNAYKYHGYSYRLCAQEAGMVVGNALLVAGPLGMRGRAHYQFVDDAAAKLLGLDVAEEHVFAAVAMYAASDPRARGVRRRVATADGRARVDALQQVSAAFVRAARSEYALPELFTGIASHSLLASADEFAREERCDPAQRCVQDAAAALPAPPATGRSMDLAEALRARCSGNVMFNPVAQPIARHELWDIVRHATAPYECDRRDDAAHVPVHLYLAVFDVTEVPAGAYRYCDDHRGLHVISDGDVSLPLQGGIAVPNLNLCTTAVALYLAADYPAASRVFGNRAYRMLAMECGLVAQRICVMAAAHGLAARIHNGYDASIVRRVFRIEDTQLTPLFQIAIAHNRPGVQYPLPIVF
jgi:SagB-type dehydrogenase family enzyme